MKRWVFAAALVVPAWQADAAILDMSSTLWGFTPGGAILLSDGDYVGPADTSMDGSSHSTAVSAAQDGASLSAAAAANLGTGEFAASSAISGTEPSLYAGSDGLINFLEGVSVQGTGKVLFTLDLTGGWDVLFGDDDDWYGSGTVSLYADMQLVGGSDPNNDYRAYNTWWRTDNGFGHVTGEPEPILSFTDSLSFEADVIDGEIYDLYFALRSNFGGYSIIGGSAYLSGLLSIAPSADVTLTFTDPNFLYNPPVDPPVIPLPAPVLLLLTGLAGLPLLRRRSARA